MRDNIFYNHDFLSNHDFSKETFQFLSTFGLPAQLDDSIKDIISINFYDANTAEYASHQNKNYLIIGDDGYLSLAIEPVSGKVFVFDLDDNSKDAVFVNSSVQILVNCIKSFVSHKERLVDSNYEEVLKDFKCSLKQIDPLCMEDNAWWYIFVNQSY